MEETPAVQKTDGYPVEKRVSAKYKGTFAYKTVTERMPRILAQVVDSLTKLEPSMRERHKDAGVEELKVVIGRISELRYQMQTDKPMTPIISGKDVDAWIAVFTVYQQELQGTEPTWFTVSWLFAECYMYRKIFDIIQSSTLLKDIDPFSNQKEESFKAMLPQITSMAKFLCELIHKSNRDMRMEFEHLVLLCLWGNRIDLSMLATMDSYDGSISLLDSDLKSLRTNLLADHRDALWELLEVVRLPKQSEHRLDFVLDNMGLEIVTDLCLAEWLLSTGLADTIHFHCKQLPWFVSDALIKDLKWTLDQMAGSENSALSELGTKWQQRIETGTFVLKDHYFWTTSYEYAAMEKVAPDLYADLSKAHLIFFKGDLNYRKLLADRNWLYTEQFSMALDKFKPTNLCALRTLKADLVTGLPPGAADRAAREDKNWMVTGQYAVLQVHNKA